jgi:hypothetical protein
LEIPHASPEQVRRRQAANLRRRVALLRYHAANRDWDGKSAIARRGGYARMAADPGGPRAAATAMALARWHGDRP